jgi:hypothetical protein
MHYGEWPSGEIDHINGVRTDNRVENLRVATRSENMQNTKKPVTNKSGKKGVSWDKTTGKWRAEIRANGKKYNLGRFKTIEEAFKAHESAADKLHRCFARHD